MSDLMTPAQLAEVLEVSEAKVMEWRRTYNWPHVRMGRKVRFTADQVERIIVAHSVSPKASEVGAVKIAGQTSRSARRSA